MAPDALVEVCEYLRDDPDGKFDMLNCITGVDYFEPDPKKAAKAGLEPHTEVVYHLSSISKKHSLVLKVKLPRWKNDEPGDLPEVPTVSGVWRAADWHEREVFDLSGVQFRRPSRSAAHPVPRRLGRLSAAQGLRNAAGISRHSGTVSLQLDRSTPALSPEYRGEGAVKLNPDSDSRPYVHLSRRSPRCRIRRSHRRNARQHGAAAPQHARRVAAGAAHRRRNRLARPSRTSATCIAAPRRSART